MKTIQQFLNETRDMSKKDSVKAVIWNDKKILILRRQNDQPGGGNWDCAGGCIEDGETQLDALKRETFEETGLKDIKNIKKITTSRLKIPESGIDSDMNFYRCDSDSVDVKLKPADWKGSDGKCEHTEYKWVSSKEEVEHLPMLDIIKDVLIKELK